MFFSPIMLPQIWEFLYGKHFPVMISFSWVVQSIKVTITGKLNCDSTSRGYEGYKLMVEWSYWDFRDGQTTSLRFILAEADCPCPISHSEEAQNKVGRQILSTPAEVSLVLCFRTSKIFSTHGAIEFQLYLSSSVFKILGGCLQGQARIATVMMLTEHAGEAIV